MLLKNERVGIAAADLLTVSGQTGDVAYREAKRAIRRLLPRGPGGNELREKLPKGLKRGA